LIYIAHRRETSNALNASVCCEQKCLQKLSETVPADNRIPQAVWKGIPDRRTSHTESPSAIGAELSWWHGTNSANKLTKCLFSSSVLLHATKNFAETLLQCYWLKAYSHMRRDGHSQWNLLIYMICLLPQRKLHSTITDVQILPFQVSQHWLPSPFSTP